MIDIIREIIRKNGLIIALYFILSAIVLISFTSILFRNQIVENTVKKEAVLDAMRGLENMNRFVNMVDLGFRGYFIIPEEKFLNPFNDALNIYQDNLDNLRVSLNQLGYDVTKMNKAERAIQEYMLLVKEMVHRIQIGDMDGAKELFRADPGYDTWLIYGAFQSEVTEFLNKISSETNDNYNYMTWGIVIFQGTFVLVGVPVLILTIISLRRAQKQRSELYSQLAESDKKFIFNAGNEESDSIDESSVVQRIIDNLKKTTDFIKNITQGNYDIHWTGLTEKNANLNNENIAGELTTMRDQMKKVKEEDEKRIWISQGLSDFAGIIRKNQNNFKMLSEELITSIVKYLDVQMGGLFIVNHDDDDELYLELNGCYAYSRLKTLEKKIAPGKGLVGQCYLEGETIYLKEVPQEYVNITSGLGDARPEYVLIVPLKLNDSIEGVIELASLKDFAPHEIEFIEKLGETLASAITTVRTTEKTNILLEQTQQQAEEMRAQEEEMRQNMEELEATQEEMQRQKDELEVEKSLMDALMQSVPEYIYFKDRDSKFIRNSASHAKLFGLSDPKVLAGKSDFDFFTDEHARPAFESEQEIIRTGKPFFDLVEKEVKKDGTVSYVSTTKMPLINKLGEIIGTFGISKDITNIKMLENELKERNALIEKEKEDLQAEQAILKTLMEMLPERITIKDDQGKYLNLSEAKYKTLREQGYENLIGKSDREIFGEEHFEKSYKIEKELMKKKKPVLNIEERIQISKDKTIWGLTSRAPFVNSKGNVLGTIAITQDISKEKECQEELNKLKKKIS